MKLVLAFISCVLLATASAADRLIIGIAGGTGSGKTTLAHKIQEALSEHSILISQDFYYKDLSHLSDEGRANVNFDHPDSLDFPLLRDHIFELKAGRSVQCPEYDFVTHTRKKNTRPFDSARVIIVEGILLFAMPEVRNQFDWKIFIDTDDDVRLLRRIERDMNERGRDFESIKRQYLKTVKPMHDAFVEPSKQHADIIVPRGGENNMALSLILSKLREQIHESTE